MAFISRGQKHPLKKAQEFDKEKIFVIKAGKKINCYDAIQEATEDTDIYETMEKYGSIKPLGEKAGAIFEDLTKQATDLRTVMEKLEAGKNAWGRLDIKTKAEYNNDPKLFAEEAMNRINDKIILEQKKKEQEEKTQKTEVKQNEQKQ